jgi:hypothetical protein
MSENKNTANPLEFVAAYAELQELDHGVDSSSGVVTADVMSPAGVTVSVGRTATGWSATALDVPDTDGETRVLDQDQSDDLGDLEAFLRLWVGPQDPITAHIVQVGVEHGLTVGKLVAAGYSKAAAQDLVSGSVGSTVMFIEDVHQITGASLHELLGGEVA